MVQEAIVLASELQWISQDDVTLEDYSFSLKTGLRAPENTSYMHTAMENFWTALVGAGILNGATLRHTRYNNWETSGGFTGWHQLDSKPQAIAGGGSSRLPTQLACVISLLNTGENTINLGRRRNRAYLGPCPSSIFGGDGKITTGNVTDVLAAVQDLNNELITTPAGVSTLDGLAIVSPTEGKMFDCEFIGCGRQMDTHRSRRQKAVEGINYEAVL